MSKVVGPYGNVCTVELELPWEIAELLVEQGPALLSEISMTLKMRKQRADYYLEASRQADFEQNRREFFNLGKETEARLSKRFPRKRHEKEKRLFIQELAEEYDVDPAFLERVRLLYVRDVKKEKMETRDAKIIRFYFQGFSNSEIGTRVGVHPGSVGRILKQHGDLIAALRRITQEEVFLNGGAQ